MYLRINKVVGMVGEKNRRWSQKDMETLKADMWWTKKEWLSTLGIDPNIFITRKFSVIACSMTPMALSSFSFSVVSEKEKKKKKKRSWLVVEIGGDETRHESDQTSPCETMNHHPFPWTHDAHKKFTSPSNRRQLSSLMMTCVQVKQCSYAELRKKVRHK